MKAVRRKLFNMSEEEKINGYIIKTRTTKENQRKEDSKLFR